LAREFATPTRSLALCARRTDRLEDLRDELVARHPGITVTTHTLDVNEHEQVFQVFAAVRDAFGSLDRVVVNAGVGNGAPIGTGGFEANLRIARTDFVAALTQCEAAMQIFRAQNAGHLVVMASTSAFRGVPHRFTAYGAAKAGVVSLGEGIRADVLSTPTTVSTIIPGTIRSELSAGLKPPPFMIETDRGCRLLAKAIEREPSKAIVPGWPWLPLSIASRFLPLSVLNKISA
jgi:short-subunit dehydrogenase